MPDASTNPGQPGNFAPRPDAALPARAHHVHLATVDSTNAYLLARASTLPRFTVVTAERQTAGRGRQGRVWQAPQGNLAVSFLFKPPFGAGGMAAFPLAAAVGAYDAMRDLGVRDAWIKWPNDILVGDFDKLVGVLIETTHLAPSSATAADGGDAVVVGIGVNVGMSAAECAAIDRPATSLHVVTGQTPPLAGVLATLTRRLFDAVDLAYNGGLPPLHARWTAASRLPGRVVQVQTPQGPLTGVVDSLNADGTLTLRLPHGELRTLHAGDVSLRH